MRKNFLFFRIFLLKILKFKVKFAFNLKDKS